jgi:RecB family exonuclease/superfamily I DNA/RNA helicase
MLITGEFHSGLEDALLTHLKEALEAAPLHASTVVVPGNLLGIRLSRELARATGGHANVRFVTLKDLALSVSASAVSGNAVSRNVMPGNAVSRNVVPGSAAPRNAVSASAACGGRALLPKRGDELMIRRLLDEGIADNGYFAAIADRPGLATALRDAITSLKEAGYEPNSLSESAKLAHLPGRSKSGKIAELTKIWKAYERELRDGGWIDHADMMSAAVDHIMAEPAIAPSPFTLYGFYDLNSLQRRLVAACTAASKATVFFPYLDIEDWTYARPTLDWFLSLGFERSSLPEVGARDVPLPAETLIISAPGEAREVREDVRALAVELDGCGAPFQDVAILTRTPSLYSELFAEELELLDAEPYVETPRPLARTRPGMSLVRLIRAVESDFARTEIIELLSVADFDPDNVAFEGDSAPVGDWAKAAALAGITTGAASWTKRLRSLLSRVEGAPPGSRFGDRHAHMGGAIRSFLSLLEDLLPQLEAVPSRATVERYTHAFSKTLTAWTRDTRERESVLATIEGLKALSKIAGRITLARFGELVRAALDEPGPRSARFGQGGPTVLNLMSARGLPYPVVIVPGLVEKQFPLGRRQDPILLDRERLELNAARQNDPLHLLPIKGEGISEEKLLFRLAVSAATGLLILSYPRLDPATARPRIPSVFMLRTLEAMTHKPQDYRSFESSPLVTRISLSRRFPKERAHALTEHEFDGCSILNAMEGAGAEEMAYLIREAGPLPRRIEMETTRWTTPGFTRFDGALESKEALAAARELSGFRRDGLAPGKRISPTSLESYASCPFKYFLERVLDIEPIDEPEEALELSPLERGSLYHGILEKFMRGLRDSDRLPPSAGNLEELLRIARQLLEGSGQYLSGYAGARDLELKRLRVNLALWLAAELRENGGFVPTYFETRFGGEPRRGDDPELSLSDGVPFEAFGGVRVEFSGKIDRIDIAPHTGKARVIDYKTGKRWSRGKKNAKMLEQGKRLQLPIYVLAAQRMLADGSPGTKVELAEYRYISSPGGVTTTTLTSAELEERTEDLSKAIGFIVHCISRGLFFPYPSDERRCRNCDYADACASTSLPLALMKNGDPKAGSFVKGLGGID